MRKLAALAGVAALGLGTQAAFGYSASATVQFDFGGSIAGSSIDVGWTSNGANTLASMSNLNYFSQTAGYNSLTYYNPDMATASQCASLVGAVSGTPTGTRKYGCRYNTVSGTPAFLGTPVTGVGPAGRASGNIAVNDTTMIGGLTIVSTADQPSGAATVISPTGAHIGLGSAANAGLGNSGYNYRSADGSPFGNYWQGVSTSGTLFVNLTGTFTSTSWQITGGTVKFTDANFECQQGGFGDTGDALAGTLCTQSTAAGGQQNNGANLSWGWDIDGGTSGGTTAISMIDVRDAAGTSTIALLSGVLASLSVDGSGNITTNSGEFRRGLGSAGGGCANHIRYNGTKIACGTLTAGALTVTGTAIESVVPVPAALWLGGSALGLLGFARRRQA